MVKKFKSFRNVILVKNRKIANLCDFCIFNTSYIVGIKASWFVNQESVFWSHKPKICKTFIFHESFFLKYDNVKIIGLDNICLSTCVELNEWDWTMKERNSVECFGLL